MAHMDLDDRTYSTERWNTDPGRYFFPTCSFQKYPGIFNSFLGNEKRWPKGFGVKHTTHQMAALTKIVPFSTNFALLYLSLHYSSDSEDEANLVIYYYLDLVDSQVFPTIPLSYSCAVFTSLPPITFSIFFTSSATYNEITLSSAKKTYIILVRLPCFLLLCPSPPPPSLS